MQKINNNQKRPLLVAAATLALLTTLLPATSTAATPAPLPKPTATLLPTPTTALEAAKQFQGKVIDLYTKTSKGAAPVLGTTDLSGYEHIIYLATPGARYNATGSYSFTMNGQSATVSSKGAISNQAIPVTPLKPVVAPLPSKPVTTKPPTLVTTKPVTTTLPVTKPTIPTTPTTTKTGLPGAPGKLEKPGTKTHSPKPTPVAVGLTTSQTGSSLHLTWDLLSLGKKNKLTSSPSLSSLPLIKSKRGSVDISSALPNTSYTFTLTSTTPARKYSSTITFAATPAPVDNLHFFRSADKLTLLWNLYSRTAPLPTPVATPLPTPGTTPPVSPTLFSPPTADKITLTNLAGGAPEVFTTKLTSSLLIIPNHPTTNSYSATFLYSNAAGESDPVTIQIPATTPSQPTDLIATVLTKSSVSLTWAYTGPSLTGQTVTVQGPANALRANDTITLLKAATSTTITGLTPGATYSFQLVAKNNEGSSTPLKSNFILVATTPTTPTGLKAQPRDGSVVLLWNASDDGGSAITNYKIETRVGPTDTWTLTAAPTPTPLVQTTTVSNLTDGVTYSYRISATNALGSSPASPEVTSTPAAVPGPVTALQATPLDSSINLTWAAPLKNGGSPITGYNITYQGASGATQTNSITGVATTTNVFGLVNGTTYTITVSAVNAIGVSTGTPVSAKPVASASAPLSVVANALSKSLTLTWTAPTSLGGQSLTSYTIQYRVATNGAWVTATLVPPLSPTPGLATALTTITSATLIGLTNGTLYQLQVAAITGPTQILTGAFSTPASVTPVSVASAPQSLVATKGNLAMNLTWAAPTDLGGLPVTGYLLQYKPAASSTWVTAAASNPTTAFSVTSLLAGTIYNFQVSAINSVGTSAPSLPVTATASSLPNAPSALTATAGVAAGSIDLSLSEPSISSPSPTTGYLVQYKLNTASAWTTATPSILALSYTISGLTTGSLYNVAVSTLNEVGPSLPRTATATTN